MSLGLKRNVTPLNSHPFNQVGRFGYEKWMIKATLVGLNGNTGKLSSGIHTIRNTWLQIQKLTRIHPRILYTYRCYATKITVHMCYFRSLCNYKEIGEKGVTIERERTVAKRTNDTLGFYCFAVAFRCYATNLFLYSHYYSTLVPPFPALTITYLSQSPSAASTPLSWHSSHWKHEMG